MTLTITIECDNAAFDPEPEPEVERLLLRLAHRLAGTGMAAGDAGGLYDFNGNCCGGWTVEGDA